MTFERRVGDAALRRCVGISRAVHTGSVSVTERRAQIMREMVHTHFNSAVHTGSSNP